MTTTTTNRREVDGLVRQTAKRLEAEGAFAEGSLDLTADITSTLEPYVAAIQHNPATSDMVRSQFIDDVTQRHLDAYQDWRYRVFPRREHRPDGSSEWVFIVQELDSPVRLKVRLTGPAEVLSVDDDRAGRSGISIHLGAHPILLLYRMTFQSEEKVMTWLSNELKNRGDFL